MVVSNHGELARLCWTTKDERYEVKQVTLLHFDDSSSIRSSLIIAQLQSNIHERGNPFWANARLTIPWATPKWILTPQKSWLCNTYGSLPMGSAARETYYDQIVNWISTLWTTMHSWDDGFLGKVQNSTLGLEINGCLSSEFLLYDDCRNRRIFGRYKAFGAYAWTKL